MRFGGGEYKEQYQEVFRGGGGVKGRVWMDRGSPVKFVLEM